MTLDEDDVQLVEIWLRKRREWYRTDEIEEYHAQFAAWNGSAYAFSFMGGRVALSAIIYALGLRPGDEVILPGYTCVVVPNSFHYAGVKTVYGDIELGTYGLDAAQVEAKITPKTRAIMLHHLYGLVCRDYDEIVNIARQYNLFVIEDCAQSTGAEYKGRKVGNLGDVAFYSSERSKVFNTVQGGIAVTNDEELAARIRNYYEKAPLPDEILIEKQLSTLIFNYYRHKHPQRWWRGDWAWLRYSDKILTSATEEEKQGIRPAHYGQKMPAPIAAIGLNQLAKIDRYNQQRRLTARHWAAWCDKLGYQKPLIITDSTPVYLRYPVIVKPEKKRDTAWATRRFRINHLGDWFVSHIHPTDQRVDGCPNADIAIGQCINLPTLMPPELKVLLPEKAVSN